MHWPLKLILSLRWVWCQNLEFGKTLENFSKVNGILCAMVKSIFFIIYNCNSKLITWSGFSTAFKLNLIKHIVDFFLGNYCPEIYVLLPRYRWFSANVTFITFISLCFILQMWSMARSTDLIADLRCDVWSDSSIQFQVESKIGSCCCLSEIFLAPIQVTEINQFRCVMKRPIFNVLLARTTLK